MKRKVIHMQIPMDTYGRPTINLSDAKVYADILEKMLPEDYGVFVSPFILEEVNTKNETSNVEVENSIDIKELITEGIRTAINRVRSCWDKNSLVHEPTYTDGIKTISKYIDLLSRITKHDKVLDDVNSFINEEVNKLYVTLAKGEIYDYDLVKIVEYLLRIEAAINTATI